MVKTAASVLSSSGSPLLDEFQRSMDTIWNCPEVKPLPAAYNLPGIFANIEKLCRGGLPTPDCYPDEGELSAAWREDSKRFILTINTATLEATLLVGDIESMKHETSAHSLKNAQNWQKLERELRHAMGYKNGSTSNPMPPADGETASANRSSGAFTPADSRIRIQI